MKRTTRTQQDLTYDERHTIHARCKAGDLMEVVAAEYRVSLLTIKKIIARIDEGIKERTGGPGLLSREYDQEICRRYQIGNPIAQIAESFGVSNKAIRNILGQHQIEIKPAHAGYDNTSQALNSTSRFAVDRECFFYVFSLARFPGHSKPGIAFDTDNRAKGGSGEYGTEHLCLSFSTRAEAFFLEQAVLDQTRSLRECPAELVNTQWGGASEVRFMEPGDLCDVAIRLAMQMEEMGVWEFAAAYVPMTAAQRALCQSKAMAANGTTGATQMELL
jgi:transposase